MGSRSKAISETNERGTQIRRAGGANRISQHPRAKRIEPGLRRELILNAALELSKKIGYTKLTRDAVADDCKIASSLVARYFDTMAALKCAVMQAAISKQILEVIAQGLVIKDPKTLRLDDKLKNKAARFITKT